jgi:hypothetical protein
VALQDELIAKVKAHAAADERVRALLLGGSLGRGDGDAFSDVDLICVVKPADHKGFTEGLRGWVEGFMRLVHWHVPHPPLPLFCAITPDWERLDLTVTVPGMVLGTQATLKPLFDHDGVHAALPASAPARRGADPRKVEAMVREFLRVLGLLPMVRGRGELAVGITGTHLLRSHGIALLVEAQGFHPPPGALSLSRVLPPEELALVERLPLAEASFASVEDANLAWAAAVLPRTRKLCEAIGAEWPEAFEAATRARLRRELGRDWEG